MTTEDLRRNLVAGVDSVLSAPWVVRRFLSTDYVRLLNASRRFWMESDDATLQRLLNYVNQEQGTSFALKPDEIRWEIWGREKGDKEPVCLYSFTAEEADSVEDVAAQLRARGVEDVTVRPVASHVVKP